MKEEVVYCGIDVAKSRLDVALSGQRWEVPNTKAAIARLVQGWKAEPLRPRLSAKPAVVMNRLSCVLCIGAVWR